MGIYLSTPKTEKLSEDGENNRLRFGLSSMQGWRANMEDAVSCQSNLIFRLLGNGLLKYMFLIYERTVSLSFMQAWLSTEHMSFDNTVSCQLGCCL